MKIAVRDSDFLSIMVKAESVIYIKLDISRLLPSMHYFISFYTEF